jgi:hypothetical protein
LLGALLVGNIWFALAVWACLYLSDYFLTIWAARLYQSDAKEHVIVKGSLEITPYFQEDVNRLKRMSLRFVRALTFSVLTISLAWVLAVRWLDIALFLVAFLISGNWFFVGGIASCLLTGLKHLDWAKKATISTMTAAAPAPIRRTDEQSSGS